MISKGKISVDVQFVDRAESLGVKATKTIALQDTGEHLEGKVAIVTGTCGTAVITIPVAPCDYTSADGTAVSFAAISRVAISSDKRVVLKNQADMALVSSSTLASVSDAQDDAGPLELHPAFEDGTATYMIVIYGT